MSDVDKPVDSGSENVRTATIRKKGNQLVDPTSYPTLAKYTDEVMSPVAEVLDRDVEKESVLSSLCRPEVANVLLFAPAGSGKTALVGALKDLDTDRIYLEVDLSRMLVGLTDSNELAPRLKALFDDAELFGSSENRQLVLFIDEFHQIVQMSAAGVEALKPVLAASGSRGLLIIGATTEEEFHKFIEPNLALTERLQQIRLRELPRDSVVKMMRNRAVLHGVGGEFPTDAIFHQIYDITNSFLPKSVQPRKSLLVLDAMIGRFRYLKKTGQPCAMDMAMLSNVMESQQGVDISFKVDPTLIEKRLNERVLSQKMATSVVANRLQLCVAGLNDKDRPLASFLFAGSTGVGKCCDDDTLVPMYDPSGETTWKRHGDIAVGDYVFNRQGEPVKVTGVFPQGNKKMYRVHFWDDRSLDVGGEHLWPIYTAKTRVNIHSGKMDDSQWAVMRTEDLVNEGVVRTYGGDGRRHIKFFVPTNSAVQWPSREYVYDPYVFGVLGTSLLINDDDTLVVSVSDEKVVRACARFMELTYEQVPGRTTLWRFRTASGSLATPADLRGEESLWRDLADRTAAREFPASWGEGSMLQRLSFIRGVFDAAGCASKGNGRMTVSCTLRVESHARFIRRVLFSLGVSNTLQEHKRLRRAEHHDDSCVSEFVVLVKTSAEMKHHVFGFSDKRGVAMDAAPTMAFRQRVKKYDMLGIRDIEVLGEKPATCIMVDHPEHVYQAGEDFIVTHNTELTKQMANLIFGDYSNHLIRFDMSEFQNPKDVDLFRSELTRRVSAKGRAIVLLDEIEKADRTVTRLLLQVLDDGRLSDDYNRPVSFLNCYFVMTTNSSAEIFDTIGEYSPDDDGTGEYMKRRMDEFMNALRSDSKFPYELLGRIDEIVPFIPLAEKTRSRIVEKRLLELRNSVKRLHNVTIHVSKDVRVYVSEELGDTRASSGGARDVARSLLREVGVAVAAYINSHPEARELDVFVRGKMRVENKRLLRGDSRIVVEDSRDANAVKPSSEMLDWEGISHGQETDLVAPVPAQKTVGSSSRKRKTRTSGFSIPKM